MGAAAFPTHFFIDQADYGDKLGGIGGGTDFATDIEDAADMLGELERMGMRDRARLHLLQALYFFGQTVRCGKQPGRIEARHKDPVAGRAVSCPVFRVARVVMGGDQRF